ncbi:hypothetical protein BRADI_4g41631v3 [Brachypodium distachyon]|uniref:CCHC-type domain-containing protein n=1 Tax=Brachypodium distachyon TaxID=15368 RepID=A0A2K2CTN6_BRADI|nr:hypothetical protein BRADI_4g41631v3 [Brachypodium distachyon]
MTVGRERSCDALGDAHHPAPALAAPALPSTRLSLRPFQLPPPPRSVPAGFLPVYLGKFCSASQPDLVPPLQIQPPASSAGSAADVEDSAASIFDPSHAVCARVNEALSSWRATCFPDSDILMAPPTALMTPPASPAFTPRPAPTAPLAPAALKSILKRPRDFNAPAPAQRLKSVAFAVPGRGIEAAERRALSPSSLSALLLAPLPDYPDSRDLGDGFIAQRDASSPEQDWELVRSRSSRRHDMPPQRRPPPRARQSRVCTSPGYKSPSPGASNSKPPKPHCFRCFASDHLVAACRDPIRCSSCRCYGHTARRCRSRRTPSPSSSPPPAPTMAPHPLPMPAPPPVYGAPALRPEEDTCFVATSFDLDRDRLDWESSAVVAWVLDAPRGTTRTDVDRAFRHHFRLSPHELIVSKHHPEEYLAKFEQRLRRDEVLRVPNGFFRAAGLKNVPPHAWRPDIVERIIGRHCTLQRIDDNATEMEDTSTLGLWAWTTNPNKIAKGGCAV